MQFQGGRWFLFTMEIEKGIQFHGMQSVCLIGGEKWGGIPIPWNFNSHPTP